MIKLTQFRTVYNNETNRDETKTSDLWIEPTQITAIATGQYYFEDGTKTEKLLVYIPGEQFYVENTPENILVLIAGVQPGVAS